MSRTIGLIAPALLAATALAAAHAQEETSFTECRAIAGDAERLACYDRLADGLTAMPDETRAAAIAAQPSAEELARLSQEDQLAQRIEAEKQAFGAERIEGGGPEPLVSALTGTVTDVEIRPRGEVRVTLDNGQVWQQISSDRTSVRSSKLDEFRTVSIEEGLLGSYKMSVEPFGKTMKVERLK